MKLEAFNKLKLIEESIAKAVKEMEMLRKSLIQKAIAEATSKDASVEDIEGGIEATKIRGEKLSRDLGRLTPFGPYYRSLKNEASKNNSMQERLTNALHNHHSHRPL